MPEGWAWIDEKGLLRTGYNHENEIRFAIDTYLRERPVTKSIRSGK